MNRLLAMMDVPVRDKKVSAPAADPGDVTAQGEDADVPAEAPITVCDDTLLRRLREVHKRLRFDIAHELLRRRVVDR